MDIDIVHVFRSIYGRISGHPKYKNFNNGDNMGMISDFISAWKEARSKKQKKEVNESSKKLTAAQKEEKDRLTLMREPWVGIVDIELDPNDLGSGAIELDWNSIFVARLVKAGFPGRTDKEIVDNWFTQLCSGVAAGTYEDEMADPDKRRIVQKRQLENGKTEVS